LLDAVYVFDLNNIEVKMFNPTACQNVICGNPKIVGIKQFHSNQSGPPINNANPTTIKNANDRPDNMFNIVFIILFLRILD
jgi:hypothetical protein